MSELSDQIHEVIMAAHKEHGIEGEPDIRIERTAIPDTPGFSAMKTHYDLHMGASLRRVYRQYAGGTAFANPEDAYEKTVDDVLMVIQPAAFAALADGIQMGQASTYTYKKYRMFKRLDEVFGVAKWREDSAISALQFEMDEDTVRHVQMMIKSSSHHLSHSSGYAHGGLHDLNKIWDLWHMASGSVIMTLYFSGYRLGQKWKQETELQGILNATDEKDVS